ncbi:MAG TPA: hypothetical protein VM600_08890, partial [Actinomycetota bacterium]|nr:hypothetical protein [Actinomycetota bacterium]
CGTVASYHAANMHASGGAPVIEPGAQIDGVAVRSVVWSGASVPAGERLVNAVRARDDLTVYVDRVARAETSSS